MKKALMIIVPIVAVAVIAGVYLIKKDDPTAVEDKSVERSFESRTEAVVESLKDAIGMGKRMECIYENEEGETKTYIEGGKYKSIINTKEGEIVSIFDGENSYSWNVKTKEGYLMKKSCMEELAKNLPETEEGGSAATPAGPETAEDIVEDFSMDKCKETGPIDFSIPSDINFVDQCEMLKNLTESLKDFQMPSGQ